MKTIVLLATGFMLGYHFTVYRLLLTLSIVYALVFATFCITALPLVKSYTELPQVSLKLQWCVLSTVGAFLKRLGRPLQPRWTLPFEISVMMMRCMFVNYGHVIAHEHAAMMRLPFELVGKFSLRSGCPTYGTKAETFTSNGLEHVWLRSTRHKMSTTQRLVLVHFHGGGYTISGPIAYAELGNITHARVEELLQDKYGLDVAVDVLLVNYRKNPEFKYPHALDDCALMYEYVLKTEGIAADHVIISGDSCGAEMAITTCQRLRDAGRTDDLPLGLVLYSPDVDMDERGGDEKTPFCILTSGFADEVLEMYLSSIADPEARAKASPIRSDLRGLPPMFIQLGELERFYQQGLKFQEVLKEQGVTNTELDVLEGMPHDIVIFPTVLLPFITEAMDHASAFIAKSAGSAFKNAASSA